jgi:hypothetical protein
VLVDPRAAVVLALEDPRERADGVRALAQRQRVQPAFAPARVGDEPLLADGDDQRQVVGRRALLPRAARLDDRLAALDDEAQGLQQRVQHGVDLEAVAAAPAPQEAPDERLGVQRGVLAELRGEPRVGDAGHVRTMDGAQPAGVGRGPAGQAQMREHLVGRRRGEHAPGTLRRPDGRRLGGASVSTRCSAPGRPSTSWCGW